MFLDFWPLAEVDPLAVVGLMAGALSVYAFIPYIRDTARGATQPERASWLIWSMLGSIALLSQLSQGFTSSQWFALVQVCGTIVIFIQSISRGHGAFFSRRNCIILPLAALGVVVWFVTDTPAYALAMTISISLLGGAVTIWKSFRNPKSETLSTWTVSLIASCLAALSVGVWNWFLLAYPLYLMTLYVGIVGAIALGRFTGQDLYVETFVWSSRRGRNRYRMPPQPTVPDLKAAA